MPSQHRAETGEWARGKRCRSDGYAKMSGEVASQDIAFATQEVIWSQWEKLGVSSKKMRGHVLQLYIPKSGVKQSQGSGLAM